MKCAVCGTKNTKVLSTREWMEGAMLRRRRECSNGHRFSTVEVIERKQVKTISKPAARKTNSISNTWLKHTAIVQQVRSGKRAADVAKMFGLSRTHVSSILKQRAPELTRAGA